MRRSPPGGVSARPQLPVVTLHRDTLLNAGISPASRLLHVVLLAAADTTGSGDVGALAGIDGLGGPRQHLDELAAAGLVTRHDRTVTPTPCPWSPLSPRRLHTVLGLRTLLLSRPPQRRVPDLPGPAQRSGPGREGQAFTADRGVAQTTNSGSTPGTLAGVDTAHQCAFLRRVLSLGTGQRRKEPAGAALTEPHGTGRGPPSPAVPASPAPRRPLRLPGPPARS
jgi:hypothetical protein